MENFKTKQEGKLYKALKVLLHNSIDKIGLPKKATHRQLKKASEVLTAYEKYEKENRDN